MWVINTVSNFHVDKETKYRKFRVLLDKNFKTKFTEQLIQFAMHKAPQKLAIVLEEDSELFKKFFIGNKKRIPQWFSFTFRYDSRNIAKVCSGKNEHGAFALEQYLFANRDTIWEKLPWQGKRGVTPVVAIQKKNLLMELDLVKTLELLCFEKPPDRLGFWESEVFKVCLYLIILTKLAIATIWRVLSTRL